MQAFPIGGIDNRGSRLIEPDRREVWSSRQKGLRSQPGSDCQCYPAIECLPLEEAEEVLVQPLTRWLEHPPEFDPEGWALPLFGEFCSSFLSHRSWLEKRREWVSDAKSKKAPAGEPSLAFNHERERSRLSEECPNSSDRNPKPGPYSPESRCAPTLGGPLIKCGEGVGETSGDSIAISWLTVTKR